MHARRWQIVISLMLSGLVVFLAYQNWSDVAESFQLLRNAKLEWLVVAFAIELGSFFVASQVYQVVLRSMGYQESPVRLYSTALTAIVMSQAFPGGGVASYAFLMHSFRRRGIPAGQAALVATMETLSYAIAMLLLFGYSMIYIAFHSTISEAEHTSLIAAGVGVAVIGLVVFVLTRGEEQLRSWLLHAKNRMAWLLRREIGDAGVIKLVNEVVHGRTLIAAQWMNVLLLIGIQLIALIGHSAALMITLHSLGEQTSLFVVVSAFAVALVTSTFNVLPGGGGTVEAAVVLVLKSLGVGAQAIPSTVVFRLMNFWILLPIAALSYHWLMHTKATRLTAIREEVTVSDTASS